MAHSSWETQHNAHALEEVVLELLRRREEVRGQRQDGRLAQRLPVGRRGRLAGQRRGRPLRGKDLYVYKQTQNKESAND